jgi:hypothetical protein
MHVYLIYGVPGMVEEDERDEKAKVLLDFSWNNSELVGGAWKFLVLAAKIAKVQYLERWNLEELARRVAEDSSEENFANAMKHLVDLANKILPAYFHSDKDIKKHYEGKEYYGKFYRVYIKDGKWFFESIS